MVRASSAAKATATIRAANRRRRWRTLALADAGSSVRSAAIAHTTMSACCVYWLPRHMIRTLAPSDPTIAPTVFAAYTPPTSRAGSWPGSATDASASGKLAPHRIAPGSTAQRHRTKSSWKLNHASVVIDGLTGQYGSDWVSMYAVHAI